MGDWQWAMRHGQWEQQATWHVRDRQWAINRPCSMSKRAMGKAGNGDRAS